MVRERIDPTGIIAQELMRRGVPPTEALRIAIGAKALNQKVKYERIADKPVGSDAQPAPDPDTANTTQD